MHPVDPIPSYEIRGVGTIKLHLEWAPTFIGPEQAQLQEARALPQVAADVQTLESSVRPALQRQARKERPAETTS